MKPPPPTSRLVLVSCVLTLAAVGLMVWSLLDPRPVPVVAAMSIGQGLGTASLGAFLYAVGADLRSRYVRARAERESARPRPP